MSQASNLVPRATEYARKAHEGMGFITVSGYDRPQTEHLQEVADLVWASGGTDIEVAAAWLHDSVEDTATTLEDIQAKFGDEVAKLVHELTDPEEIRELPTAERKQKQAERICTESESARKIKLADQTSNVRCLTVNPKEVAWTVEGRRNYALGAKAIAEQCMGINSMLDAVFNREYTKVKQILDIGEDTAQTLERLDKDC